MASWGDMMLDEDRKVLTMTNADWWVYLREYINTYQPRRDVIKAMIWVDKVDKMRARLQCCTDVCRALPDPEEDMYRLWLNMVSEPEKYGDDIVDVLEMEKKLMLTSKRWRVAAYWSRAQYALNDAEEEAQATKIQAAWRGHQVRDTQEKLNCGFCLARKISPCYYNGNWICYDCVDDADQMFYDSAADADWVPCECCGTDIHASHEGDYRDGFFCCYECASGSVVVTSWS